MFVDVLIADITHGLINVYCSNNSKNRREFIQNLSTFLVSNRNIICGGDWNCVQNSLLDKYGSGANFTFGCEGANEINFEISKIKS